MSARARPGPLAVGIAAACLVLVACVDNQENAQEFCASQEELLAPARDGERLDRDEAERAADDVAESMRNAEDATRPVRGAARDLTDAYDELVSLLGDEDATAEELRENRTELEAARRETRRACAEL